LQSVLQCVAVKLSFSVFYCVAMCAALSCSV